MRAYWEHFAHEADMGVRGVAPSKAEAFEQAALAMTAIVAEPSTIKPTEEVRFECDGPDDEVLFTQWLNSLIYEMSTRKMLFAQFAVRIERGHLYATAWGEHVDVPRHHPVVEIKGATYTALRVAREHDVWVAQTVVDV